MKIIAILGLIIVLVLATALWRIDDGSKESADIEAELTALEAELEALEEVPVSTTTPDATPAVEAVTTAGVEKEAEEATETESEVETIVTSSNVPDPVVVADKKAELISQIEKLRERWRDEIYTNPIPYHEIVNPSGFVNSEPFELKDLVGDHVILVKFTTYSCINCQRTYPYVIDWYQTYKDQGLAVVAIHTPEFAFEKDIDNVRAAMEREGIDFPVVLDNDFSTWRAYGNRFWPRLYLIDVNGDIVYDHIGEGAYDTTERVIQELLKDL